MKRAILLVAALVAATQLLTGCANRSSARVDPSADLQAIKTMYVVKVPNDNAGIDTLIADKLRARGYTVTTGGEPPANTDAVVTYIDRWWWDITMYLLELTVTIRDPKTDFPLASANSLHSSLTRKSPPEMVAEVMDNLFKEARK